MLASACSKYYYGECSSELADLVPPKPVTVRSTHFSEQMYRHTVNSPLYAGLSSINQAFAEPTASYNIIVTGNTSRLRTVFNPLLVFVGGSSCHCEMALIKLETYYSFLNIKATNTCMEISIDKGVT